ncbi:MAG TPA: hypothetical protein DGT23_04710 [Micromonosporaceae bacterium]|nr:hypothetical protein [Micromonosporaceae bacterium]
MSDFDHPVQLILDASALAAYGNSETVGELLSEVEEEDHLIAIPQGSLAQALGANAHRGLLALLLERDRCVEVDPMEDWEELGKFLGLVGTAHDLHDAAIVLAAVRYKAYILTDRPSDYTRIFKGVRCIKLEAPWAD